MGQFGALYAIWLREVKRALRDRGQLIGGLSRPILWVILLGIGLNPYFRGEIYGEARFVVPYTYIQFIFPAVIVLNILLSTGCSRRSGLDVPRTAPRPRKRNERSFTLRIAA